MKTSTRKKEDERVEFRVSKEDKAIFEQAQHIKGFKTFSEFVRIVLKRESQSIIKEDERILVSRRDKQIFFDALMGKEEEPNQALISAMKFRNEMISE